MSFDATDAKRLALLAGSAAVAVVAGWFLFVYLPAGSLTRLVGVLLVLATVFVVTKFAGKLVERAYPSHDVAEIAIDGPIHRDADGNVLSDPDAISADDVVERIHAADERPAVEALVVTLNTPGGQILPSEDIRMAIEAFDGPTVAYATDTCASGGYWIASGCDRIVAREESLVGSIGVIGSVLNASDLAERLGLSYERISAGEFKDAGNRYKEIEPSEREYLQGIVDAQYEAFLDRVTTGRDVDRETVSETEARLFLGTEALDVGLVDELGTRSAVKSYLAEQLGKDDVAVEEYELETALTAKLLGGFQATAYAFGAGLGASVGEVSEADAFRLR